MERKKILVIGSSNIDITISCGTIPVPGETIKGTKVEKFPGGKGANQAVACGKLGGAISFLSVLGNGGDEYLLTEMLASSNVCDNFIKKVDTVPTGTAYIAVDVKGRNSIIVVPGANDFCSSAYLDGCDDEFVKADIVLLQMEIPSETVYHAVEKAYSLGKTIILNPAPAPNEIPDRIYKKLDYITPNETELAKLTHMPVATSEDVCIAAKKLLAKGVGNVIVTLGGKGAMLINGCGSTLFTPPDIKVVDTTAAGDTFNGAVCVALSEGRNIGDAITFANIASTISVSRKGAQSSIPSRKEVDLFSVEEKCNE